MKLSLKVVNDLCSVLLPTERLSLTPVLIRVNFSSTYLFVDHVLAFGAVSLVVMSLLAVGSLFLALLALLVMFLKTGLLVLFLVLALLLVVVMVVLLLVVVALFALVVLVVLLVALFTRQSHNRRQSKFNGCV